jgi:hypothetical protein
MVRLNKLTSKIFRVLLLSFFILLLSSSFVLHPSSFVYAEVPHLINYQGRFTDTAGAPLNGSYNLTFRIYDAETAGNLLWEETQTGIVINKGIFAVLLGSVTNLNLTFDKPYFLEIKVGNEVMSPRQRITSAGYAIRAENAEKIRASDSDTTPGTLTAKTKNSIVVDNNQLQLSGDVALPGNDKLYGTNSNGVKGWYDRPGSHGMQVFASSGTWIKPAGVNSVFVKVWGAGGGGAKGGGGSGGYSEGAISVNGNISVIVGIGGSGGISCGSGGCSPNNGQTGGNSSFGTFITANGGLGGSSLGGGGNGGGASGGALNFLGNGGGTGNSDSGGVGGKSAFNLGWGSGGDGVNGGGGNGSSGANGSVIVYW